MFYFSDRNSITAINDNGDTLVIPVNDVSYHSVRQYLFDEKGDDFERLHELVINQRQVVEDFSAVAAAAVDGDDQGSVPYRVKHGDPVADVILTSAVRASVEAGEEGSAALAQFLLRLEQNPSAASRSQLFAWIKAEGFSITRDGFILGYKKVTDDFLSLHSGREEVTVVLADGTVEKHMGRIPYAVGSTVSMERSLVDDDRHSPCSVGLHVGTFGFADTFAGGKIILVKVDPKDVVAVPRHSSDQKMRVCKLTVLAVYDEGSPIQAAIVNETDYAARDEYQSREENVIESWEDGWDSDDDDSENDWWGSDWYSDSDEDEDEDSDEDEDDEDSELPLADWEKELLRNATAANPDPQDDSITDSEKEIVKDVSLSITIKLGDFGTLSLRDIKRGFSVKRRDYAEPALELLISEGTVSTDENGRYHLA